MNLEVTVEAGSETYEGRKYSEGWDYWESEKKYSESQVTGIWEQSRKFTIRQEKKII